MVVTIRSIARCSFLLFVVVFQGGLAWGQNQMEQDLLKLLSQTKNDIIRMRIGIELSEVCEEEAMGKYCRRVISIADSLISQTGPTTGNRPIALYYKARALSNLGMVNNNLGNSELALKEYETALRIYHNLQNNIKNKNTDLKLLTGKAELLNNIGYLCKNEGNYTKALDYYTQSNEIWKQSGNASGIAYSYNNLGKVYERLKNHDKEFFYYRKSIEMWKNSNDMEGLPIGYSNLGYYYFRNNNYDSALRYLNLALRIHAAQNSLKGTANVLTAIANLHLKRNKLYLALDAGLRAYRLAQKSSYIYLREISSLALKDIYLKLGNSGEALKMFGIFIACRDSLTSLDVNKKNLQTLFRIDYEKKVAADSLRGSEEKKLNTAKFEHEKSLRSMLIALTALAVLFCILMYFRFRIIRQQKAIIEEQKRLVELKQKEILDSIHYAKRIQQSLLTSEAYIRKTLTFLKK